MTILSDGVVFPRFTLGQIEKKNLKSIEGNWLILFHEVHRSGLFFKNFLAGSDTITQIAITNINNAQNQCHMTLLKLFLI